MFKNKKVKFLAAVIVIVIAIAFFLYFNFAKKNNGVSTENTKLKVVTSFYPLYFFASQIAQDKADVYNITPAGSEPHDYEPSTQDVARIEDSQLLILNGGKLEAWGDNIKNTLQGTNTTVITVGENLTARTVVEDGQVITDPHVWLSLNLAKKEIGLITDGLIKQDPQDAPYYQANAKILVDKLDNLNSEYIIGLKNCAKKDIVTSHAAFGYLAADYGLNQVAIAGLSPDAEPTPKQLAEVTNFVKTNSIKYIFFESLVSPKLSETIASEVGAKTLVLNPIEGLSDEDIHNGKNYFTEMENNLINLKIALQCQ